MQKAGILLLAALMAYFALQFWPDGAAMSCYRKPKRKCPATSKITTKNHHGKRYNGGNTWTTES